jgi:transposase
MKAAGFQAFLRLLRQRHGKRAVCLLLDKAPGHTAAGSLALAAKLNIILIWLPEQWSELNAMDHLWRELKRLMSANRQCRSSDEQADYAEHWVLKLTPRAALRKAGVLSKNYWLKHFLQNF